MFKIAILLFCTNAYALNFNEAVSKLGAHQSVLEMKGKAKSLQEISEQKGSWGDPVLKVAAKNFPVDTLDRNQTPMTGIEIGVSQKIPLTNKYGKVQKSVNAQAQSLNFSAKDYEQSLIKLLWANVIEYRKIKAELAILKENLSWIAKILRVSKKLYSNGRITQQALLDIQIRKSEIESELSNKTFELKQNQSKLTYIINDDASKFDYKTIPWKVLSSRSSKNIDDNRLKALEENRRAQELNLEQADLAYVPDMTVSVGYTMRSDEVDNNGDFISAQVSFPLPFSDTKSGAKGAAVANCYVAVKKLQDYQLKKKRDISIINDDIRMLKAELSIISKKSVNFAQNSRSITSKSYGLGNSSYIELLQSELRLQKILLKKVSLEAKLSLKEVDYKYTLGESLYE